MISRLTSDGASGCGGQCEQDKGRLYASGQPQAAFPLTTSIVFRFTMAPAVSYQSPVAAAAQDAFDVKLNQTVFIIAFISGAIILFAAMTYLCFWVVRNYRSQRALKLDEKTDQKQIQLPKQFLLSNRTEISASFPRRLILSPFSTPRLERNQPRDVEHRRALATPPLLQGSSTSSPAIRTSSPCSEAMTIQVTTQTTQGTLTLEPPSSPSFEIDHCSTDSTSLTCSSVSTIVEVIEPFGFAPRIVVEDFAPGTVTDVFRIADDTDSDSDMSIEDEKIDRQFLVVPPMSWIAPRDPANDNAHAEPTEKTKNPRSKSMSSMLSLLSDISNVAKIRPKLPSGASMISIIKPARRQTSGSPTPKTAIRALSQLKEKAMIQPS